MKTEKPEINLADIEALRNALGGVPPGGGGGGGGECVPDTCMCPSNPWDQDGPCKSPCPSCW
ncbi:MAG TPA: hypothetical protein VFG69_03070 [Nannocystaceae bacterium]|nr:hypothetical protein [Nannocystaceae bacterium]